MDALVQAFLVAALSEAGSRTGLLAAALSRRFGRSGAVIAGVALAAILNMAIGCALGSALASEVPQRVVRMLVGASLLLAGGGALFAAKPPPEIARWRLGPLASSAAAFFILAFGDRGQFAVGALAAASGAPILAAAGGSAGVVAASIPPILFAGGWGAWRGHRPIRWAAASALLLAGAVVTLGALEIA